DIFEHRPRHGRRVEHGGGTKHGSASAAAHLGSLLNPRDIPEPVRRSAGRRRVRAELPRLTAPATTIFARPSPPPSAARAAKRPRCPDTGSTPPPRPTSCRARGPATAPRLATAPPRRAPDG